jgi:Subtilase family
MRQALGRIVRAALIAGTAGLLLPPVTQAGELSSPLSQAVADRGTWLPSAPPPARPAGICIVDSGVDLNPDTQPVVLDREALDGGELGDVSADEHGTLVAMNAAAPLNGWGTIGTAPNAVRIVSIRAELANDTLPFAAIEQSINRCQAIASTYNIKVINLSVGFQRQPSPAQLAELADAANRARNYGLDVVAAAGDEGTQMISYPAAQSPILAVGASGADRTQCSFSNTGPQLALLAPGCDLQEVDPVSGSPVQGVAGNSISTAIVAATLAALRAYRPDLGPAQAEDLLTSTAQSAGGTLDIAALFQTAGLGWLIAAGERTDPRPSLIPTPTPRAPKVQARRLPRPRVRVLRGSRGVVLRLLNRPNGARTMIELIREDRHRAPLAHMLIRQSTIRLPATAQTLVRIIYVSTRPEQVVSSPARVILI